MQLFKNGESILSPTTAKLTYQKKEKETIDTMHVDTGSGVYVGVVTRYTPNGSMQYAFKFEVKE